MSPKNSVHVATCVDEELAARLFAAREQTFAQTGKKVTVAAQVRAILQEWIDTPSTPLPEEFERESLPLSGSLVDGVTDALTPSEGVYHERVAVAKKIGKYHNTKTPAPTTEGPTGEMLDRCLDDILGD